MTKQPKDIDAKGAFGKPDNAVPLFNNPAKYRPPADKQDDILHDNQYMFPDGTIVDFGNRDPQEVLDEYVANRERSEPTPQQSNSVEKILRKLSNGLLGVERGDPSFHNQRATWEKQATHQLNLLLEQNEQKHIEIYRWLLGMVGSFPHSRPGKRYNWRSELRKRLPTHTLNQINKRNRT